MLHIKDHDRWAHKGRQSHQDLNACRRLPIFLAFVFAAIFGIGTGDAYAAKANQADTSRKTKEASIRSIPFDKLDANAKKKVSAVVQNVSIFRRMPVSIVDCDPDLFKFMVRNPEVIVNIWEVMGITKVDMKRTGPGRYRASDGVGTLCDIQYVHRSDDLQVIYASGAYTGTLVRMPIKARCVLVLKSRSFIGRDGKQKMASRMDVFMRLDHAGVALLAKAVQPLIGKSADYNFTETASFLGMLSRTAKSNKSGVQRLAAKLTDVEPAVRTEFEKIVQNVALAAKPATLKPSAAKTPVTRSSSRRTANRPAAGTVPAQR